MEDNLLYWLWLQHALGPGSTKPRKLLAHYGSARACYESGRESWEQAGIFTQVEKKRMADGTLEQAAAQLRLAQSLGQSVICPDQPEFPVLLREIPSPPCVLYYKGTLPPSDALCIAMVGTRQATPDGLAAADRLSYSLAKAGVVVVSGGALGIDSACHRGALRAGGKTLCILGCGIDYNYLMKNAPLRETISQNGALISEYPPNTPSSAHSFPIRNRLISGLCAGTVVVEAAKKSGALITVSAAIEQGRDVFAVPGAMVNEAARGANELIREGAKPVMSAQDILEEYPGRYWEETEKKSSRSIPAVPEEETAPEPLELPGALSANAAKLYQALGTSPRHITEIALDAGLSVHHALAAVTELELCGRARSFSGRRYSR